MQLRPALLAVVAVVIVGLIILALNVGIKPGAPALQVSEEIVPASNRGVGAKFVLTREFFSPNTLTINEGDTLTLGITSPEIDREVSAPSLGISNEVPKEKETTLTTQPLAAGTIIVYCTHNCNPGVNLTITVQERVQ